MNTYDPDGSMAVVTGGAQGMSLAFACRLKASGAMVSLWDANAETMERAASELGVHARAVDITDADAVTAAHEATEAALGPVDVAVNSAGVAGPNHTLETHPVEAWHAVVAVDLLGTCHVNRAVVPSMRRGGHGRIVNVASIAGEEGDPNASA